MDNSDLHKLLDRARWEMGNKRRSRIWFDPDTDLLNALCEAEKAVLKVLGLLNVEGKR